MENKEFIKKYSVSKKTAIFMYLQVILIFAAFVLSIVGIVKTCIEGININRVIIYSGQALTCLAVIIFSVFFFNKKETKYFRNIVLCYAILEAIRVSLLQTAGVPEIYAILVKFLLVMITLNAALLSDRMDKKEGYFISRLMLVYELVLYAVFMVGFPILRTRLLYIALPFIGPLISGSLCLFVEGRLEQIKYSEKNKEKDNLIEKIIKKVKKDR